MEKTIQKLIRRSRTTCPFRICADIGIHVRFHDLGQGTRGLYYKKLRRRFIVVHSGLTPEWQRFICAHELGHDRLHSGMNRFFTDEHSFFTPGKYERQANRFAIKLLSHGFEPQAGDSLGTMLKQAGIPEEMHAFY